ncbi:MAG: site-specific integrase [Lentisphaerae bacterium]|nr:site-specific integrase [Lentisphaerota bacterium]
MAKRRQTITFGTIFKIGKRYYFENKARGVSKKSLKTDSYATAVQEAAKRFGHLQLETDKDEQEHLLTRLQTTERQIEQAAKPRIKLKDIEAEYVKVLKRSSHSRRKLHADATGKMPLAETTLDSTLRIVKKFREWLELHHPDVKAMSEVTPVIADDFFAEIRDNKGASTYNNYRGSLHVVWGRLAIRGGIDKNPFDDIKRLQKAVIDRELHPKRPFSFDQLEIVFDKATGWIRPAVHIGYETGLRMSDVCTLRRDQLDLDGAFLDLTGQGTRKAGKEHIFYMPDSIKYVREWLATVPDSSEYVFPELAAAYLGIDRRKDRSLANKQFMRFLWKICKFETHELEYQTDDSGSVVSDSEGNPQIRRRHPVLGFHSLRVSHATYSRTGGATISDVQKQLGHSSQDTTSGYIQEDKEAVKRRLVTQHRPLPQAEATNLQTLKQLTRSLEPAVLAEFRDWVSRL